MNEADDVRRAVDPQQRVHFERLVCDLAARFVNLPADRVDDEIRDAQRQIVEALDLDRSTLFQLSDADGTFAFTHYWSRPEFPPPRISTVDAFPWALAKIRNGELVCFTSIDDLPSGVRDRESIARVGTRSNVTVPLKVGGTVVGAVAFGSMRHERQWPDDIVNRLVLVGQVFASALARKRADIELRRALDENDRLREQLAEENEYLQREVRDLHGASNLMGQSDAIQRVLLQIEQVATAGSTVLLLGETGTGKELLATAIHERSRRRGRAMVCVHCGAIPGPLFESELFGREKGAYTGALTRQAGRFELASGSTIFLDEIGDVPLEVQVKLLRILETRQVERLGGTRPIDVDVRVVAATNRDLERAIAEGRFREDLYYRLNVFPIKVPPLRERKEDIPVLVRLFVDEFSRALGKSYESVAREDLDALLHYDWPGNVRELRNVIERSVIVSSGPRLRIEQPRPPSAPARSSLLADVEREHVRSVLETSGWRIRGRGGAAERLGLKPSTLEGRMAKLDLRRPQRQ